MSIGKIAFSSHSSFDEDSISRNLQDLWRWILQDAWWGEGGGKLAKPAVRSWSIFNGLHGMQTRSGDKDSVRPSVCLSVCQTRAL